MAWVKQNDTINPQWYQVTKPQRKGNYYQNQGNSYDSSETLLFQLLVSQKILHCKWQKQKSRETIYKPHVFTYTDLQDT